MRAAKLSGPIRLIGHAGLAAQRPSGAPDLACLDAALRLGVALLEVDVWRTADNALVLQHDGDVGSGISLGSVTLDAARSVRPDLITLDEALAYLDGRLPLLLDLKGPIIGALCAWLVANGGCHDLAVCTDDPGDLLAVASASTTTQRWLTLPRVGNGRGEGGRRIIATCLRHRLVSRLPALAAEVSAVAVSVDHWSITRDLVTQAHSHGLSITAWTVNSPSVARRMDRYGCDFLTTDKVAHVRAAVGTVSAPREAGR